MIESRGMLNHPWAVATTYKLPSSSAEAQRKLQNLRNQPKTCYATLFGFPLTDEFLEGRPQFTPLMEKCPHADGEERLQYAFRVRSAILMAISLRTRRLWYNTCIEMSTSGPVIALATDWQSTALPPPEVIKSIQTSLRIDFEPRWVNA
ncbi:hypothetical protein CPB85DRAFT_1563763 [Mucidula mucida]|nr:hypothetical protein CPB85DRAFT_1563763 [Mucidula mucida]